MSKLAKLKEITKKYLLNNLQWKIFSIIIAAILWIVALNIIDPVIEEAATININIANRESLSANNRVLLNEAALEDLTVSVTVRGNMLQLTHLRDNLSASIDLAHPNIISGASNPNVPVSVAVNIEWDANIYNYRIVDRSLHTVDVFVDDFVSTAFEVTVNYGNTSVAGGHRNMPSSVTPSHIIVEGPRSAVNSIDMVRVDVDLGNRSDDFTVPSFVRIIDFTGAEIQGVTPDTNRVNVTVPVLQEARIPITIPEPRHTGTPSEGFGVVTTILNISDVSVIGSRTDVAVVPRIPIDPINVSGASSNVVYYFDLLPWLAERGLMVDGSDSLLEVTVLIERLERRSFTVSVIRDLSVLGAASVSLINPDMTFPVVIEGFGAEIDELDPSELAFSINLSDLDFGFHNVQIQARPPEGITIIGQLPSVGVIIEDPTPPTPTPIPPTPTPTPTPTMPTPTPTPVPTPTPTPMPTPVPTPTPAPTPTPTVPTPTPIPPTPEPSPTPAPTPTEPPDNGGYEPLNTENDYET